MRMTAVVVAAALGFGGSAMAAESLTVVERAVSDTTIDLGEKGDSLGDLLIFANPIYDARNEQQLGTNQGYCIRVAVGKSHECFWTLVLKDGQITAAGPFLDEGDSTMTVTGGTGRYAGAKGSLHLRSRDAQSTAYDFRYELL